MRCWALGIGLLAHAALAQGQAIERHLPGTSGGMVGEHNVGEMPALEARGSERELGVVLRRVVVAADGEGEPQSSDQIVIQGVPAQGVRYLKRDLSAYMGRQLSEKVISEISNLIIMRMRRLGYPLVAVTVPEQEISTGILTLKLTPYRLGQVDVVGGSPRLHAHILRAIRQLQGEQVDARHLSEDLESLNEYPFRSVDASFSKGVAIGTTNLALAVRESRPYRLEAGYLNVGSLTGHGERYYVGLVSGGWPWHDFTVGLRLTGSADAWLSHGSPISDAHPRYRSAGISAFVPLAPRQGLDVTVNLMETNQSVEALGFRTEIAETSIIYRSALSNFVPARGQVRLGVELRRHSRQVLFDNIAVSSVSGDILQTVLGWNYAERNDRHSGGVDIALHFSPGHLTGDNTPDALTKVAGGDAVSATYGYLGASAWYSITSHSGFQITSQLSAQVSTQRLPISERIGLSELAGLAAYGQDSGAYDDAVVFKATLHAPPMVPFKRGSGKLGYSIQPYLFGVAGYVRERCGCADHKVAAIGGGMTVAALTKLSGDLAVGRILAPIGGYKSGTFRLTAQARLVF